MSGIREHWGELQPKELVETAQNVAAVAKFLNGKSPFPVEDPDKNAALLESLKQNAVGSLSLCYQALEDPRVDLQFAAHDIALLYQTDSGFGREGDYYSYKSAIGLRRTPQQTPEVYLLTEGSRSFCQHPSTTLADAKRDEVIDTVLGGSGWPIYRVVKSFDNEGWDYHQSEGTTACRLELAKQRGEIGELNKRLEKVLREHGPNWSGMQTEINEQRDAIRRRKSDELDPLWTVSMTRALTPDDLVRHPFLVVPFIRGLSRGFRELKSGLLDELRPIEKDEGLIRIADGFEKAYQILDQAINPQAR